MTPRFFILCLVAVFYQSHGQRADTNLIVEITSSGLADTTPEKGRSTNLLATGAWSEPVSDGHGHKLRGRLLVYVGSHLTNRSGHDEWTTAPAYLEIQDMTGTNQNPTLIYFDLLDGLIFELRDANGAPADKLRSGGFRGGVPPPFWATLPGGGLLRLSANKGIHGGGRDGDVRLIFHAFKTGNWIIPAGDTNAWFLSATLLSPPPTNPTPYSYSNVWQGPPPALTRRPHDNSTPYKSNVWQGSLEVPAAKLSAVKH